MSNIETCKTLDELRAYSMQDLCALYSKITKTHAPKFSDKGAAAKRILPMLEQKRSEATVYRVTKKEIFPGTLEKLKSLTIRGRPPGQLANRIYHFDFDAYDKYRRHLAPQARQIVDQLEESTYTEAELQQVVKVKTKQDPWRIFQYYRPKLLAAKILRIENAS